MGEVKFQNLTSREHLKAFIFRRLFYKVVLSVTCASKAPVKT